jgi:hypothetical protein
MVIKSEVIRKRLNKLDDLEELKRHLRLFCKWGSYGYDCT